MRKTGWNSAASAARPNIAQESQIRSPSTSPAQNATIPLVPRAMMRATRAAIAGPGEITATKSTTANVRKAICSTGSHQHGDRLFKVTLQRGEQLRAECTVDHTVIAGERDGHLALEAHAAVLGLDRPALRSTDREDGRLRRVDDRGEV